MQSGYTSIIAKKDRLFVMTVNSSKQDGSRSLF